FGVRFAPLSTLKSLQAHGLQSVGLGRASPDARRSSVREGWAWYHVIVTTYAAWLYGDARGFRTRHHREHVEGDYKNPPVPGQYEGLEVRSRAALKQAAVVLPPELRELLGLAIKERLERLGAPLVCIAVCGQHVHLLAEMPINQPRAWMGIAKKHGWFA